MNEHSLHDPQLQSLEAKLAATAPQLSAAEQQRLLYQCAFAAGQSSANRTLRRWQVATAALAALLLVSSIPIFQGQVMVARQPARPGAATEAAPQQTLAQDALPPLPPRVVVELDAWQVSQPPYQSLVGSAAALEAADPALRSLTVSGMTRTLFNP